MGGKTIAGVGLGLLAAGILYFLFAPGAQPPPKAPAVKIVKEVQHVVEVRREVLLIIPSGFAAGQVAAILHQGGIIKDENEFLSRAGSQAQYFQSGTYHFTAGESEDQIIASLVRGS